MLISKIKKKEQFLNNEIWVTNLICFQYFSKQEDWQKSKMDRIGSKYI